MGKKLGLKDAYNRLKAVTKAYPITGGTPTSTFMKRRLQLGATSGKSSSLFKERALKLRAGQKLTTSVNKGSKLLNIGKKVFSKTPVGRAVNLAVNVGSGIGIGYGIAKNKFKGKSETKVDKKSAGGEMNQMNIKGYMGGGASRGYGAARTSGMGLQDESLMPGKMVRANKGKMLSAKQKKIASKAPPRNKITGADFKAMKVKKASLGLLMDAGMKNKKVMGAGALGLLSMLAKNGKMVKMNRGGGMDAGAAQGKVDRIRAAYNLAKKNKGEDRLTQADIKMAEKTLKAYENLKKNK